MDLGRKRFTKEIGGRDLILEVSNLASQTNASVIATYGQTTVLATVVMDKEDQDSDYFPLRVDYEEKFYAAGKILGSRYMRREGRPSDDAVLSGRVVDRVIRPLFDQHIRKGVQVVVTVLSYDGENDPDFVALMAASSALAISDIPWGGPVAGLRVAKTDKFIVSPTNSDVGEVAKGKFDAFIAGTAERINMIELGGYEITEEDVAKACELALVEIKELVDFQNELVRDLGEKKVTLDIPEAPENLVNEVRNFLGGKLEEAIYTTEKKKAEELQHALKQSLIEHLQSKGFSEEDLVHIPNILEEETDVLIKRNILEQDRRPDGRGLDEVRDLYAETGTLPRMHGSAIFVRGDTQALAITTLGGPGDEQLVENVEFSGKRRFLLHYNFPPYSVGEAKASRGPGRRDIGHGVLAHKALEPLMPKKDEFPYTVRVVSEILSSNGSSSMATVSASSMSLMDAGVPLKAPVAGIAMGLVLDESGKYKILTDIQGPEDHYGGMDFKVAGTKDGINAVQLDVKVDGLTLEMIRETLSKATKARLHILQVTNAVIDKPRSDLSPYAPRILVTKISPDRIGELIGPGGKVINGLIEETGVDSIDIDDDGTVMVTTPDAKKAEIAIARINAMMREYAVGEMVEGDIIKLLDFGAIVDLGGGKDGMVHISEFKDAFVKDIKEVAKEGDHVKAKVISVENGRIGLSVKRVKE
ncbi:MAG: polyribonucleotide nucleotidyltransferase [Candidatus Colwellbacteria bacterium GWA2_46_10]|uniref:Polyribonucleotide nucleotidyltransferase n=2 Tax=Parcubacteria group TaxID=1794811 RepID=A0A1G1YY92_9BACT|nr:MAG: Polyribonucleotide nucleotidyltransferase [Parcubacteria group bacterium GW2011_GWA2_46_10]OGY56620.1 MAG: polyribonucleotide nucleotidyltransferase [Candidatus Colwellbacteria bacterium GWA2_46_10]